MPADGIFAVGRCCPLWRRRSLPILIWLKPGRSYAKMSHAPAEPDFVRGQRVYASECAVCHGKNGEGQQVDNRYVFPPLWGKDSYNWGAGMHQINTAANSINANMPLGERYSLSDQQAWDVALFINSQERLWMAVSAKRPKRTTSTTIGTVSQARLLGSQAF